MALTSIASGTTTTDGTEQTLATDTTNQVYVLALDLSDMINGDVLEVRLKTKVLSGGTSREAYLATYSNVQSQPQKYSVPVPADIEIVATMKAINASGTTSVVWKLLAL